MVTMHSSKETSDHPVAIDVDRMKTAQNMPRRTIPDGLTIEQMREHILATAERAEGNLETHQG
ncbi:hypothetical protein [Pseudomonas sp. EL_65y_Pfl2_R96]|uniref:hypothetical protein n=1 Tax=Pseudomonas sp. EL_65y_Pfl2_R96 TaxID=3088699 RepID=UPI0030DB7A0B